MVDLLHEAFTGRQTHDPGSHRKPIHLRYLSASNFLRRSSKVVVVFQLRMVMDE
jgi:hypothetical protein